MSQSNPPPNPFFTHLSSFLRFARKPSTLAMAMTSVTLILVSYTGLRLFLREYLPPWLEQQVSQLINRPIEIGELTGFSFTSLQLEGASIPETSEHSNELTAQTIRVQFNPLAVIFQQTLPIIISPETVTVKIREDGPGNWFKVDVGEQPIPIDLDLTFDVKKSKIFLLPHRDEKPIKVQLEGNLRYQEKGDNKWIYAINLGFFESDEIQIIGETVTETTQTNIQVKLNQLALQPWLDILPNQLIDFAQGNINANLNFNLPSLRNLKDTQNQGDLELGNFQAAVKPLKEPITANFNLNFEDNKIFIHKGNINLGNIITDFKGFYDWERGSNIDINVKNFTIDNLLKVIPFQLPFKTEGKFNINAKLTGILTNPLVELSFINNQNIIIANTTLKTVLTEFRITFNQTILKKILIETQEGAKIQAEGKINQNFMKLIQEKRKFQLTKLPFNLEFQTEVPLKNLINDYYSLASYINLNLLKAEGKINGTIEDINGLINWKTSADLSQPNTKIISQGNILIKENNWLLKNTKLETEEGIIDLQGRGSLKTKKWQTYLNTDSLTLTPFTSIICVKLTIQCPQNIVLSAGNIRLSGKLEQSFIKSLQIDSNILLAVEKGRIVINSDLKEHNFKTDITILQLPVNTFINSLPKTLYINNSRITLSGSLEDINSLNGNGDIELKIGDTFILTRGKLQGESLETTLKINGLLVNQIISEIPFPVTLVNSDIKVKGNWRLLLFSDVKTKLNHLEIIANSDLLIDNRSITAKTEIEGGLIKGNASLTPLSIAPFVIEGYPIIKVRKAETNFTGNLSSLLALDFQDFQGDTQTEIEVAEGIVTIDGEIKNDQIFGKITTQNIDLSSLNTDLFSGFTSDKLNSQINASVSLTPLLTSASFIPFTVNTFSVQVGEQTIDAQGDFIVSNIWTSPDIERLFFEVDTDFNLSSLPLTQLLTKIPINRRLLPETLDLQGTGEFTGTLLGKNLLTAPFYPGNLEIVGNLRLANLTFNKQQFEPELIGKINIDATEKIVFNLEGKQDIISAVINPCFNKNCPLLSLVDSLEISQTYQNTTPIIATVKRNDDTLIAKVESLPIDVLKIAPLSNYGLPNYLEGLLNIDISFNPLDLNTIGKITINSPRFGSVIANQFEAKLSYTDNIISLERTLLSLGESNYNIVGNLNIKSGEIQGKIDINKGNIEDLLTALELSNWDSLLRFLQLKKTTLTNGKIVTPNSLGKDINSIAEKLYEFWINDQKIKEKFAETQAGDLPRELDFQGQYNAAIILEGTLQSPQLNLQFEGEKWRWNTQLATASIVRNLGLVLEGSQVIPIEKIRINGQLKDGIMTINPKVNIGTSIATGNLSLSYQDAKFYLDSSAFKVKNLTLDLVRNLIIIPSDINGSINVEGTLNGTLDKPEVDAIFEFNDGVINARVINQDLAGKINYSDDTLKVETTKPDFIDITATLPFPIVENSNENFAIKAILGKESFTFLQPLTLDQIIWIDGDGDITVDIKGQIFIDDDIKVSLEPESEIDLNLNNARFTNNYLSTSVTLNGYANLKNSSLNVEKITADIAKTRLNITGSLPLLPLKDNLSNLNDPLTINISQHEINQSGLYQGLINGNITILGALISPKVGGNINFSQGKLRIPSLNLRPEEKANLFEEWIGTFASRDRIAIPPQLDNFQISIDKIAIENKRTLTIPKVFLNLSGDLILNGKINNLSLAELLTLQPSGKIKINRGKVNLPVTRVFISRQNENTLTFFPNQGLLNPNINLELKLYILAVALRSIKDNEITDDIVQSGRSKSAEITLKIKGSAKEVLPNIAQNLDELCEFNDNKDATIHPYNKTSSEHLRKLARCVEINNLGTNSIADLLRSPIVSFSSNPPLSNTELLTLFGQQLPDLFEKLQKQNSTQLLEAGVIQAAIVVLPFLQDLIFEGNEQISEFGQNNLGLTNLRVFPVLETVYKLEENSLIRFSYDYTLGEATIRYENKF
ncbi:MAG: translocation/assembly module TamB domain-containing protein [Crocosphaera sp.]